MEEAAKSPTPHGSLGLSDPGELVDRACLALRLGVDVRTVSRMVNRRELPRPCLGEGGRPRWLWEFVVEFCRKRHEQNAKVDARMRGKLS